MNEPAQKIVELLDAHGPRLHAWLARATARHAAAEDLLQELFLRLLCSKAFENAPNPEAYLVRSAINIAFDWRKSAAKTNGLMALNADVADQAGKPIDALIETERVQHVLAAMDALSERDRELLCVRYLDESTYESIAELYETSAHRFRSRCAKAVARLRKVLESNSATQLSREGQS